MAALIFVALLAGGVFATARLLQRPGATGRDGGNSSRLANNGLPAPVTAAVPSQTRGDAPRPSSSGGAAAVGSDRRSSAPSTPPPGPFRSRADRAAATTRPTRAAAAPDPAKTSRAELPSTPRRPARAESAAAPSVSAPPPSPPRPRPARTPPATEAAPPSVQVAEREPTPAERRRAQQRARAAAAASAAADTKNSDRIAGPRPEEEDEPPRVAVAKKDDAAPVATPDPATEEGDGDNNNARDDDAPLPRTPDRTGNGPSELRALLAGWIAAHDAQDVGGMMGFYAPRLRNFYGASASAGTVRRAKQERIGRARRVDMSASGVTVRLSPGGDTATMTYRKRYAIEGGTRSANGTLRSVLVWRRVAGNGWRIVSEYDL
jgi:ketosteroid isomerase-like protein